MDPDPERKVRLEKYDSTTGLWGRWRVERVSPDGSVLLRNEDDLTVTTWVDLTQEVYRWATGKPTKPEVQDAGTGMELADE